MESQPQNPEFRINPEIFHPCINIQTGGIVDFYAYSYPMSSPKLNRKVPCSKTRALFSLIIVFRTS